MVYQRSKWQGQLLSWKKAPQNPEPISHDKSVCASIIQENQKTVAEFVPEYRNVDINYEKKT